MLRFLTAGESHGPGLIGIVEGLPAGLALSEGDIDIELRRRQVGYGRGERMKIERDEVEILSGVANGLTTGAPVALRIENKDWVNWRDVDLPPMTIPRPGHADLAGALKYGHTDLRHVSERASARETAMRVAIGAIGGKLLAEFDIRIGSFVVEIGGVTAQVLKLPYPELFALAEDSDVRCPDGEVAERMRKAIDEAKARGDSVGGVFTIVAIGVPPGLGSFVHWDRRLDGRLAWAVMSIPGVKAVEIGEGFANARRFGTQVHDEIFYEDGGFVRRTNRAGGLEGGVTNGQPVILRAAMKPIPTTLSPLRTVDMATKEPTSTRYQRSDVCAVPAASVVGEAMVAWVLAEALAEKIGGDSIKEMRGRDPRDG